MGSRVFIVGETSDTIVYLSTTMTATDKITLRMRLIRRQSCKLIVIKLACRVKQCIQITP